MSLREELSELMRIRANLNSSSMGEPTATMHDELAWAEQSADFLRDHGQALLDALEDGERLGWLFKQWSGEALRNIGVVYSEPSEYRQAIDAARRKTTDQAIDAAIKGDG